MKKQVGRKRGVSKVTECDFTRLIEGDDMADMCAKERGSIRRLNAWFRGNLVDRVIEELERPYKRKAAKGFGEELGREMIKDLAWLLGQIKQVAERRQSPEILNRTFRGLYETNNPNAPRERMLAVAVGRIMSWEGDFSARTIYKSQAEVLELIHLNEPGLLKAKDRGRSTLHQALSRWGIKCEPRV